MLASLAPDHLRALEIKEVEIINKLQNRIKSIIEDRKKLLK